MTDLLDGNVLVALTVSGHVHHEVAVEWFSGHGDPFATCPITQGTLVRFLVQAGVGATDAQAVLAGVTRHDRHRFWADELDYGLVDMGAVVGHRQVTDAYLAELARRRSERLLTLDGGLAQLHDDVAVLMPSPPV